MNVKVCKSPSMSLLAFSYTKTKKKIWILATVVTKKMCKCIGKNEAKYVS